LTVLTFDSSGSWCEATLHPADSDDLVGPAGRPCVVMAHGFGTTRDSGLAPFAAAFVRAGCDVLTFDYRGFGGSEAPVGAPRQDVDHRRHREDYRAALAFVRARPGVDPDRVALWGTSYSGGHVLAVAAEDHRVAAVVSQGAAVDGLAALTGRGKVRRPGAAPRRRTPGKGRALAAAVADDLLRARTGRPPRLVPFVGDEASGALISGSGAVDFEAMTGPTFRNEMCARGIVRIAANRPIRRVSAIRCPTLLVVAEHDEIAPSTSVHDAARRMGEHAEVAAYPCEHFALYAGPVHDEVLAWETAFLLEHLRAVP